MLNDEVVVQPKHRTGSIGIGRMKNAGTTVLTRINVNLEPLQVYETLLDELATALHRQGIRMEEGAGGRVMQGSIEVGRVVSREPGKHLKLQWQQVSWESEGHTEIEFKLEPAGGGTQLTLEYRGLDSVIHDSTDLVGWFVSQVAAPLLRTATPDAFGDWITDRRARRPSGAQARSVYRDPLYHYPNFRVILKELALKPDDYLLEVACGGGALLKSALLSGCRAAAIDHSPDMVRLASEENREAIAAGRLEIVESNADRLPFPDAVFTCATMTGVLGFLSNPVTVLSEMLRVLRNDGRIVIMGTDPELRGTPAAPEPMAARLRFYNEDQLERLGREAGFRHVTVIRRNLETFAREAGVPEEQLPLFAGAGARFLVARKE
jgi:SAM-dependent methyltransferase